MTHFYGSDMCSEVGLCPCDHVIKVGGIEIKSSFCKETFGWTGFLQGFHFCFLSSKIKHFGEKIMTFANQNGIKQWIII
jgi:hypothetical protein